MKKVKIYEHSLELHEITCMHRVLAVLHPVNLDGWQFGSVWFG